MTDLFDYKTIFSEFEKYFKAKKDDFCRINASDTKASTNTIKEFFHQKFKGYDSYNVYSSRQPYEFLYDVCVMNCNPKEILSAQDANKVPEILLSVESELGGSGANYSAGLLKNLSEDFFKILHSSSKYRIFIGINDVQNVQERVKVFQTAYKNTNQVNPILLILINGVKNKEIKGNQIQIDSNLKITGYILKQSGTENL